MKRRSFLKGTLAGSTIAVAAGAGLLAPTQVLAAAWPKAAFASKSVPTAIKDILGTDMTKASSDVHIKVPDIAENGAVVPVSVETGMKGVDSIAILVEKNPTPLIANFHLAKNCKGYISTRIKMGKTSDVIAVVKAGKGLYSARKEVKVTIGGCGG